MTDVPALSRLPGKDVPISVRVEIDVANKCNDLCIHRRVNRSTLFRQLVEEEHRRMNAENREEYR